MIKKLLAATVLLFLPALVFAGGSAGYADVAYVRPALDIAYDIDQYEGEGHRVVDLTVDVDDLDQWTTAYADAYFWCVDTPQDPNTPACGTFWEHPEGGNTMEEPSGYFQLDIYDSFWTCPEEYPNPDLDPTKLATTFAPGSPLINTGYRKAAEWYADPEDPNVDGGLWTLARYNFTLDCSLCPPGTCVPYDNGEPVNCYLIIEGDMYYASTGGLPWAYSLEIPVCWVPEPGSLGLLALGTLALIRRR